MIDAALARVNVAVTARPKVLRHTITIIPPRLSDVIDLERCEIAVVLIWLYTYVIYTAFVLVYDNFFKTHTLID